LGERVRVRGIFGQKPKEASMDYGGLVKRALEIMWKFKYLWVFGFFLEFGSGGGGGFGNLPDKIKAPVGDFLGGALIGAIVLLVLVGLVVFLLFLIMYIISQGGLFTAFQELRPERTLPCAMVGTQGSRISGGFWESAL